jgi:hypothetical protein
MGRDEGQAVLGEAETVRASPFRAVQPPLVPAHLHGSGVTGVSPCPISHRVGCNGPTIPYSESGIRQHSIKEMKYFHAGGFYSDFMQFIELHADD